MLHVFLSGGYGEYIDGDATFIYVAIVQKSFGSFPAFFPKLLDATFHRRTRLAQLQVVWEVVNEYLFLESIRVLK